MKKKNTIPSGFEDILGNIYSNAEQGESVTNADEILEQEYTPLVEEEIKEEKNPPVNTEDGNQGQEDDSPIPPEVINNNEQTTETNTTPEVEETEEPTDADVIEAQQVGLLFDAVGQSLGWNMSDIDEKERPLTVDQLTEYLAETVRQNSIPEYSDERVQKLDEYVRNGGKFEDFYKILLNTVTLDNIDMDDESNQKAVIRELLKHSNYSDEQINKKIQRYEDADMLYEESEDALERLKQIRQAEVEQAQKAQEEYAKEQEEKSKAFFNSVVKEINSLTDIRGISIPKEDRKALFEYIFKVDANGVSQYQKDFAANQSKNLIESAYFTMKADALISNAKKSGETSAAEKLRNILRHSSKNHTTYNADEKQKSVTDLLAGAF